MRIDDLNASRDRASVDSMVNGEPPFNQEALDESGQGDAANFNTREATAIIREEAAAYYDLINQRTLVTVKATAGDENRRKRVARVVAKEFSDLLRSWDGFVYHYNLLALQLVKHGVAVAYFPDEIDFRFRSCGLAEFKLPRDTPATEEAISVACATATMTIEDMATVLRKHREAAEAAKEAAEEGTEEPQHQVDGEDYVDGEADCGWNIPLLRKLMTEKAKTLLQGRDGMETGWDDPERVERRIKENGIYFSQSEGAKIHTVHMWVREESGKISHGILLRDKTDGGMEWLYFRGERFETLNDCLTVFIYDLGDGTYHTIRGRGYLIQPQVIANNALACRLADGAASSTQNLLRPVGRGITESQGLAVAHFGNNEILPPGVEYIQRNLPDFSRTIIPAIRELEGQLRRNNTGAKPTMAELDKNAPAIAHQLAAQNNASLSAVSLSQFYNQADKLMSAIFRRVIFQGYSEDDPGGRLVRRFINKLKEQDVSIEDLEGIEDVAMVRSVGGGSPANRMLSLQRLSGLRGAFDPEGQNNWLFDMVAEEVGPENAARYVPEGVGTRQPVDAKIAELENGSLMQGTPVQVLPNENHMVHLKTHLPPVMQIMQAVQQAGEKAPFEALVRAYKSIATTLPHLVQHAQVIANDKFRRTELKAIANVIGQISAGQERLANTIGRLQEAARAQQEAEAARQQEKLAAYIKELEAKAQSAPQGDQGKIQAEIIKATVRARISEAEHAQKLRHKEESFNLERAIRDARAAAELTAGVQRDINSEE